MAELPDVALAIRERDSLARRLAKRFDETEQLRALLGRFVDDEPCRVDHHGNCQTHGHEQPCAVAEARRVLGRPERADRPATTRGVDPFGNPCKCCEAHNHG